ncbi:MAG: aspartate 1-decarboxylase [Planctomycetia bacterium]
MQRTLLKSKIHGARVTQADLNYVGSITIDRTLLDAVDLWPHEKVLVVNLENGARLETYVFEGEPGSGVIGMNGGCARLCQPGDRVLIMSFATMTDAEARQHVPKVCFVGEGNTIDQVVGTSRP